MSIEELDFQFLDEGNLIENENGLALGFDSIFGEPDNNPLFGYDINLAATIDQDSDFLVYAPPTDSEKALKESGDDNPPTKIQQSPWHESDSGMSEVSFAGSPRSNFSEDNRDPVDSEATQIDQLDVETSDVDINKTTAELLSKQRSRKRKSDSDYLTNPSESSQALQFFSSPETFSSKVQIIDTRASNVFQENQVDDRSRKNAIQAKINREKKKAYIKSLEDEIQTLKSDNTTLKSENAIMHTSMKELEEEVAYLKSVLVNSSALSNLLKNIPNVSEVRLSSTILGRKQSVGEDHSYNITESPAAKRRRAINENLKKAGVCLHVNGDSACLEFCAHCSKLAQKSSLS